MSQCRTIATWRPSRNSDVVAFCPYEGCEHILACGSYELLSEEPPRRLGALALLSTADAQLEVLHETPTRSDTSAEGEGVLDCAWLPVESARATGARLLATASSEGCASLFSLATQCGSGDDSSATVAELRAETRMACDGAGVCMSLDWSRADGAEPRVALTSTAGMLFVGALDSAALRLTHSWQAHELEGWAVAFGTDGPHTLFSGADDGVLRRWDLRAGDAGESSPDCPAPIEVAANRRSHGAGVCCISPSLGRPHLLATGSYDEKARLWDARRLRHPLCELECGGGVWRLRWHPERPQLLLAACMHAGFRVLSTGAPAEGDEDGLPSSLELGPSYEAHGTGAALGYGADWAHRGEGAGGDGTAPVIGATCSFYDRQLHLWALPSSS